MCGFAGVLHGRRPAHTLDEERTLVERMAATLSHRGPDDEGSWVDLEAGIALAHRRLAILDLSPNGRQPMASASSRYVVAYNGEIYNFTELRRALEPLGHRFRGTSDTEVLLASLEQWGFDDAVRRWNGMFALALWDRVERTLHLVRDRLGKKPLYYGWVGNDLVFGSELKALRACPGFPGEVDRAALSSFLRYRYVPAPFTIYRDTFKLPQASWVAVAGSRGDAGRPELRAGTFWSGPDLAERAQLEPFAGSAEAAADELDALLRDAIARRLIADVPVGAFLSGGIDSSTVVALMRALDSGPVRTYSVGFDFSRGEAAHAAAVAKHLGTDHTEIRVGGEDTVGVVASLPDLYDEPFADSSQVLTYIICKMAREHVTVALSGDGGDELFFGYGRYARARKLWALERPVPRIVRRALALGVRALAFGEPGEGKLHDAAADLAAATPDATYRNRVSCWNDPAGVVVGGAEPRTLLDEVLRGRVLPELEARMMLLDLVTYLPDDILVKVDRASMGVSLEVRAPLLDHRVVELALRFPTALKLRDGTSKWILRQVLARYVPPALTERAKGGFGAPIRQWLQGPLREWAAALLAPERLVREGYFRPEPIRVMWEQNASGRRAWHNHLWPILMFQAWLARARPV